MALAIPLFYQKYDDYRKFMDFTPNSDDWFLDAMGNKFRYEVKEMDDKPYLTLVIPKLFAGGDEEWTKGEEFPIVFTLKNGITPSEFSTNLIPLHVDKIDNGFTIINEFNNCGRQIKAINKQYQRYDTLRFLNTTNVSVGSTTLPTLDLNSMMSTAVTNEKTGIVFSGKHRQVLTLNFPNSVKIPEEQDLGVKVHIEDGNGYVGAEIYSYTVEKISGSNSVLIIFDDVIDENSKEVFGPKYRILISGYEIIDSSDKFLVSVDKTMEIYDHYDNLLEVITNTTSTTLNYLKFENNMSVRIIPTEKFSREGVSLPMLGGYLHDYIAIGGNTVIDDLVISDNKTMHDLDDAIVTYTSVAGDSSWMWSETFETGIYTNAGEKVEVYYSTSHGTTSERNDWVKIGEYDTDTNSVIDFKDVIPNQTLENRIYAIQLRFKTLKGSYKIVNGQATIDEDNSFKVIQNPRLRQRIDDIMYVKDKDGNFLQSIDTHDHQYNFPSNELRKIYMTFKQGGEEYSITNAPYSTTIYRDGDLSVAYDASLTSSYKYKYAYPGLVYNYEGSIRNDSNGLFSNSHQNPVISYKFNKNVVDVRTIKNIKIVDKNGDNLELIDSISKDDLQNDIMDYLVLDGDYYILNLPLKDAFGSDTGRVTDQMPVKVTMDFRIFTKEEMIANDPKYEALYDSNGIDKEVLFIEMKSYPQVGNFGDNERTKFNFDDEPYTYGYTYLNQDILKVHSKPIAGYYTSAFSTVQNKQMSGRVEVNQNDVSDLEHVIINEVVKDEEGNEFGNNIILDNPRFLLNNASEMYVFKNDIKFKNY